MNTTVEHETRMIHLLAGLPLPAAVRALPLALHESFKMWSFWMSGSSLERLYSTRYRVRKSRRRHRLIEH